jgi:tetratricopeptide (TPR) repeat protein
MKPLALWLIALTALPMAVSAEPSAAERLGTVSFSVSCSPASRVPFSRGAREMLADMPLESGQSQEALIEYEQALTLSPNRFNGLFHAGLAAEAVGDKVKAKNYYEALLKSTDNGAHSARPEFDHVKAFISSTALALQ